MEAYLAGAAVVGLALLWKRSNEVKDEPEIEIRNTDSDPISVDLLQARSALFGGRSFNLPLGLSNRQLPDTSNLTQGQREGRLRAQYYAALNDPTLKEQLIDDSYGAGELVLMDGNNGKTMQTLWGDTSKAMILEPALPRFQTNAPGPEAPSMAPL